MLKYHMEDKKSDKTIIFITGAGVGKWMWACQSDLPYNLVTFDLPGHGENAHVDFESIAQTSDEIIEILNDLKLEKVVLIGHSIGAQIILYMLEHKHQYIDKAVVISGLNHPSKMIASLIKPTIAMSMPLIQFKWFSKLQASTLSLPNDMFEAYYVDSLKMSKRTLVNLLIENQRFAFNGSQIEGDKVLFMVGSKEVRIMKKSVERNHNLVECSSKMIFQAGHGIPYEVADEFNTRIKKFLEPSLN